MEHSEGFKKLVTEILPSIDEISVDDVLAWRKQSKAFTLIDVREDHEWATEHIDNAFHLSKGIIERDIEKTFPNRNTCLVLYCGGGYRSALAAYNLKKMGYDNISSMAGGFRAWKEKKPSGG